MASLPSQMNWRRWLCCLRGRANPSYYRQQEVSWPEVIRAVKNASPVFTFTRAILLHFFSCCCRAR